MKQVVVGIDIGGTNTRLGLIDREGKLLTEVAFCTPAYKDIEAYVGALAKGITDMLSLFDGSSLSFKGIGIGAPNGNYYKGTIEQAPNLPWKGIVPLVDLLQRHFDVPVSLTNDANAAAIGEMIYGGAKRLNDFLVVTLGTGLGSGFVSNGELVYGHDGFAGEMGHMNVDRNGRDCACGLRGCLETYVSATGICRTVFELLAHRTNESRLRDVSYNNLTSKMIKEFADNGDPIALEAFEITGRILGEKLADVVAVTSPEVVFILGGLAQAGDYIFKPAKEHMEKNLLPIFRDKVQLRPSEVEGVATAVVGASALAWKEIWKLESQPA